jgi:hypothetical protein
MAWMRTKQSVTGVVPLGLSTRRKESVKTSSVPHAVCTKLWSSSMAPRSVFLGRETLISKLSQFQCLTANPSYQVSGLVATLTVVTPIMS